MPNMTMNMDQLKGFLMEKFKQICLESERRLVDRLASLIDGRQPQAITKAEDFTEEKTGGSEWKESVSSNDFERSTGEVQAFNVRQRGDLIHKEELGFKGEMEEADVLKGCLGRKAEVRAVQISEGEQDFAAEPKSLVYRQLFENG